MRILLALAATAALVSAANASPRRAYADPPPPPGLSSDEVRDYWQEQTERRHAMERAALRMSQKAELRARGLDEDDD